MVGSAIGAFTSSSSGNKAAKAQIEAAQIAANTAQYFYDTTRSDQAPARQVGQGALYKLADMYGVARPTGGTGGGPTTGPGATPTGPSVADQAQYLVSVGDGSTGRAMRSYLAAHPNLTDADLTALKGLADSGEIYKFNQHNQQTGATTGNAAPPGYGTSMTPGYDDFQTSPGYQFRLSEGVKAAEHSASARGLLGSGAAMKAVQRYGEGLASSEYENYANRLASLAGIGQQATQATSAAGTSAANTIAQTQINAGNARASAYANTGAAINNGIQNAQNNLFRIAGMM